MVFSSTSSKKCQGRVEVWGGTGGCGCRGEMWGGLGRMREEGSVGGTGKKNCGQDVLY